MREKIAKKRAEQEGYNHYEEYPEDSGVKRIFRQQADQILSLFQEEIERLEPLSDEEINRLQVEYSEPGNESIGYERNITQAQLAKTKSDLRKVME